jgi:hypothetical protein
VIINNSIDPNVDSGGLPIWRGKNALDGRFISV